MSPNQESPNPTRVPYEGTWLDGFSLTAVAGGALLAGGSETHSDGTPPNTANRASFWDASKQEWLPLPPLPTPRFNHAAVALGDGRVLLIGGRDNSVTEMASTLLWDPTTREFKEGPPLREARAYPVARVLPDGAVLVLASELDDDLERGTRAELLRPGASAWEPAGQTVRIFHVGPVCVSGERVVIAGGRDNGFGFAIIEGVHYAPPLAQSTEIWEPGSRTWRTSAGPMLEPRDDAAGVTLSDGRILVVGGWHEGTLLKSTEVWDPRTEQWSPAGTLSIARSSLALTALPDGRAAVSGGLAEGPFDHTKEVEIWEPERRVWTPGKPMEQGRAGHRLVAVGDGAFLVVGIARPSQEVAPETTWELWRPFP
ncbi:Kelch repeat-containing protein [Hyalangium gracile]|uniref:Kelch repeat-containing protein n=1 Tax=Hyalangium gracile TaxID=394092 RepID=UPI001CC9CDA2|nr:kelch motif-containing protein [Hyalangium gracile]